MRNGLEFVGIGEVLMDLFQDGTASLGGAPLNVAVNCHRLLHSLGLGRAVVVSAVGDDEHGRHIRAALESEGFPLDFLEHSERPTGTSSVFLRDGEPGFEIAQDVAWDDIRRSDAIDALAERCDAICFGSLAQRAEPAGTTIQEFVRDARKALILYDVNFRTNTLSGTRGYSRETVETSARLATVIKANANEIAELGRLFALPDARGEDAAWRTMDFLLREFPVRAVVVTRGAQGALLLSREERIATMTPAPQEGELHPVGAGDAFAAGLLFGMAQGWPWRKTLELAGKMGTWVAYSASDIPPLPAEILDLARGGA